MKKITEDAIKRWDDISFMHLRNMVFDVLDILKLNKLRIKLVDVGSNVGKFTKTLLDNGIDIEDAILVEPIEELLNYSKSVIKRDFQYLNCACSSSDITKTEKLYINYDSDNLGTPRIHPEGDRVVEIVPLTSILKMKNFDPDVVKLDCEGLDYCIALDLFNLLQSKNLRPLIIIEYSPHDDTVNVLKRLYESLGYKIYFTKSGNDMIFVPNGYIHPSLPSTSEIFPTEIYKNGINNE